MAFETADRRGVAELVAHCLQISKLPAVEPDPAGPGPQPLLPIVLLWGPRSSGKSELLDYLQERFASGRPYVRRDGPELSELRPHEVALKLASHLSCRVQGLGRLRFPRLSLGTAAIRGPLDVDDTVAARSEMIRRTVPNLKRLRSWVGDAAAVLLTPAVLGAGLPPDAGRFLGLALGNGVGSLVEKGLVHRARTWYQDGLDLHFPDPVDALVRLAEWEAVRHQQSMVDETLCRAFLADLRDEYEPRFYHRTKNCLALLDDADSTGAQRFLEVLAAQRTHWDPLLIVAATSTRAPSAGHQYPERWVVRDAAKATYLDWSGHRHEYDGWATQYPVTLSGLTLREATMHLAGRGGPLHTDDVKVTAILGGTGKALRFAYRLTGGHLGGMRLVLRTMSLQCRTEPKKVDVRGIFGWPVAEGGSSLAEEVWRLLADGHSEEMRKALLRATAAPDFTDDSLAEEPEPVDSMMRTFRSRDLWVRHPLEQAPTLHPFPRRAVTHLLAQPSGQDGLTWDDVYKQLRDQAKKRGDATCEMYHCLALGEVRKVTEHLSELFEKVTESEEGAQEWYADLTAITQAPLAHPAREANSKKHCLQLTQNVDGEFVVPANLVAALQLHADPLGDPDHHLCLIIAQELKNLTQRSHAFSFMADVAEECRIHWRRWHQG